jgi:hypothetical protein
MKSSIFNSVRRLFVGLSCAVLAACYVPPKTNLLPDLYPSAMLVEPIKMRRGFVYTSSPIEAPSPDQLWEVSLGFERKDAVLPGKRFFCLLDSRQSPSRTIIDCPNDEPGVHVRWELLREDGTAIQGASYDAIVERTNSQSTMASLLVGLGALRNPGAGTFRVRLHVLRDFPELDITNPQLVVNMQFFQRRQVPRSSTNSSS